MTKIQSQHAPNYLRDSDEFWHDRPEGVEHWSENYLSGACFPDAGAGVWLHHSRPGHDPRFWDEIFSFALPGDRFLYAKAATIAVPRDNGPVGAALTYDCEHPYGRWRKSFHGLARLVSGEEARSGPLADGPHLAVDMDLTWHCIGPPFDMDMSEQVWAEVKAHYQQHCRVSGSIEWAGKRLELDGIGVRDHSWGPRNLHAFGNHSWIYGQFPSGRRFMYFFHSTADGHGRLDVGHEIDDAGAKPIRVAGTAPSVPRDPKDWAEPWEIEFARADGTTSTMRGEILEGIPLAMTNGSELQLGAPGPDASHHLFECPSRLEWDGEIGYGITEWSWRTD